MTRSDILLSIHDQFDRCAEAFCQSTGGNRFETDSSYKGEEKPENLRYRSAKIFYDTFALGFRFTAHGTMSIVNSILECLVYTDRTDEAIGIPLHFVVDFCDEDISTPLTIPLISSPDAMTEAFDCLGGVLNKLFETIRDLSFDSYRCESLAVFYIEELYRLYGIKDYNEVWLSDSDYSFLTLRFTSDAYICYLKGERDKAIKKLEKAPVLCGYEKRLLRLWKSDSGIGEAIPTVRYNAQLYNTSGVQKSEGKEFLATFLSWLVITPVASVLFVGLYFLLMHLEGIDSVYLMGPIYSFPMSFFFAFLTGIAASYFCRHFAYKLLFRKSYERYCEMDSIQNGGGADKLMHVFLWLIVLAGIAGCILFTKWNLNFKEDGFVDNTSFFSVKGTYYSYSDIDHIYYKPDRINDFGEKLDNPSYVIVMNDGREIDLYEYDNTATCEKKILTHLISQGVSITGK